MNNTFLAGADLFQAADFCAAQVCELVECHDAAQRRITRQWLAYGLETLKAACDADLPPYLIAELTADELPALRLDDYWPDDGLTLDYCAALARVLSTDDLPGDMAQPLTGLLHDLVNMLADQLKAPRFTSGKPVSHPENRVTLPHVRRLSPEAQASLDPFLLALYRERREMLQRFKGALDAAGVEYYEEANHE